MLNNFRLLNNLLGWLVFLVALVVYTMTVERTASFWDCGEFIACSYKLQVPHPPGAPFFLLLGRMFSLLAFGNVLQVAFWVNMSSVVSSAFTILFLFWTITLLGLKIFKKSDESLTPFETMTLMGASLIGSLAYTFSDSFWFSAVEAEVYALSSFFTAFVVWAMLKWERIKDENYANRWLIMICYMVGLSIGVHLLNLVTIPALGLIYYHKKYAKGNIWGMLASLFVGFVIIILILYGVIPGLPSIAGNFEISFVNTFGLPFGSGIIFFSVLFLGSLLYGIYYSIKNQKVLLNTVLLCFSFILIGYASYGIVLIRSFYNPPINENDPSDIIKFVSYLKREQYGDRPLMYGPGFTSKIIDTKRGDDIYRKVAEKNRYEVYDHKTDYIYDKYMLLPRIYSRSKEGSHPELYRQITGLRPDQEPTMYHNIVFMLKHQLGHMYFRYFLWNFAGRAGDDGNSNWLNPFEAKKGPGIPEEMGKDKARNQFYMLPLILGLIGLFYQAFKDERNFLFTFLIFFMTGIALVLYLNSPPTEPRERDYIYAGSYYAFAMWMGIGFMALVDFFKRYLTKIPQKENISFALALVLSCLPVGLMAFDGWDDHNRANRYQSVDSAKNLLNSCAPNAILFTGGDNDTFPLWYVQEVEGFRTDVRVCNLSLLGTDWYIQQMKRPTYKSAALPISLKYENYISGTNDQVPFVPNHPNFSPEDVKDLNSYGMNLEAYVAMIKENDPSLKVDFGGTTLYTLPTKKLILKLDKAKIMAQGFVPKDMEEYLSEYMVWDLTTEDLYKNDLMILDMVATNNKEGWKRPIYFSSSLSNSSYLNLKEYLQQEGIAYRLLPIKVTGAKNGYVNSDLMYKNMTENFFYRELDNPSVFYSDTYKTFPLGLRNSFYRLAAQLLAEGDKEKAKKALDFCMKKIPDKANMYDVYTIPLAQLFFEVGDAKQGTEILKTMARRAEEVLRYVSLHRIKDENKIQTNIAILAQVVKIMEENKIPEAKLYEGMVQRYYQEFGE